MEVEGKQGREGIGGRNSNGKWIGSEGRKQVRIGWRVHLEGRR